MTKETTEPDFILTFVSQFSLSSVSQALMTTLPLYLLALRATEVEIGVLIGSLSVASLVLRPFVGRLLLRRPERAVIPEEQGTKLFSSSFRRITSFTRPSGPSSL